MDVRRSSWCPSLRRLIPFLGARRREPRVDGSNMQRQAVPLLVTEAPFVATGLKIVSLGTPVRIVAEEAARWRPSPAVTIIITRDGKIPETKKILARAGKTTASGFTGP